jgi:hypothetical protein
VQAVAGHSGLAHGRATLHVQGWPNLQRAQQAAQASAHPALQRGRESQAAQGWPSLRAVHESPTTKGYPHLAQGRANLAARGWPNWLRAQDVLKAQEYLPLLDAQQLRRNEDNADAAPQTHLTRLTHSATDRRHLRSRATRMAILEALHTAQAYQAYQAYQACQLGDNWRAPDPTSAGTNALTNAHGVTARMLAAQLQIHPATVYAHLKQIRLLTAHEMREMREMQDMLADGSQ